MTILVFGTSHVSAIKLGWNELSEDAKAGEHAEFVGISAPVLAKQTYRGWQIDDGAISATLPEAQRYMSVTSSLGRSWIRPSDYTTILLVDLYYCYDFAILFAKPDSTILRSDGTPISTQAYRSIVEHTLGRARYSAHPVVGDVPESWQLPLIRAFKDLNPDARYFLTPRPFSPANNISVLHKGWGGAARVREAGVMFDTVASAQLASNGVEFIPRTSDLICNDTGATPDRFSKGWRDENNEIRDEHMNGDYGISVLGNLLKRIHPA